VDDPVSECSDKRMLVCFELVRNSNAIQKLLFLSKFVLFAKFNFKFLNVSKAIQKFLFQLKFK
jgi:hypothetical protein